MVKQWVAYCEGVNVNEAILDNDLADIYENFCDVYEFEKTNWTQEHACSTNRNDNGSDENEDPVESSGISTNNRVDDGDSSNDLNCKDFNEKNIPFVRDDPNNIETDGAGIGCEG